MSRPIATLASQRSSHNNSSGSIPTANSQTPSGRNPLSSSFIERHFGRRPKTAQAPLQASSSSSHINQSGNSSPEPNVSRSPSTRSRHGLPRSSSSSRVNLSSDPVSFPTSEEPVPRRSPFVPRLRPSTAGEAITHSDSSRAEQRTASASMTTASGGSSGGGGGGPFGRMFRRYSHGRGGDNHASTPPPPPPPPATAGGPSSQLSSSQARATSTPPRVAALNQQQHARSSSAANSGLPSYESAGLANSHTVVNLANESRASPSTPGANGATDPATSTPANGAHHQSPGPVPAAAPASPNANAAGAVSSPGPSVPNQMHRIRLVPHLEATRSLHFEPIERDVKEGASAIKIGRFTDRQPSHLDNSATVGANGHDAAAGGADSSFSTVGQPGARGGAIPISGSHGGPGRIDSSRVAFKSKVVSRGHAEVWCEAGGKFFIRDTKSSSGTFLNHIRLSAPNVESRAFSIKDGDVIQLGVDYQGGTEEIYRCVKMRVELNRGWQREANQFNVNALRQLRALQGTSVQTGASGKDKEVGSAALPTNRDNVSVTDCCICLFSVTVCQALFIAPCSHVFHYKCIRPMLTLHHPGFSCPLCRTFADLDADVEEDEAWQEALLKEAEAAELRAVQGKPAVDVGTPRAEVDATLTSQPASHSSAAPAPPPDVSVSVDPQIAAAAALIRATSINGAETAAAAGVTTSPSRVGRGTAPSAARRAEWARPDTAVGSSVGPMFDTPIEGATASPHLEASAEVEESAVVEHVLDEAPPIRSPGTSPQRGESHSRRGSGPIDIGARRNRVSLEAEHDSRTPMNNTFLSTLAERDFHDGRSAPARETVPTTVSEKDPLPLPHQHSITNLNGPVYRAGSNLNASAYRSHTASESSNPGSESHSPLAKFKRKVSG